MEKIEVSLIKGSDSRKLSMLYDDDDEKNLPYSYSVKLFESTKDQQRVLLEFYCCRSINTAMNKD